MKTNIISNIINNNLQSSPDAKRDYVGASSIGSPCLRQVYYSLHSDQKKENNNRSKITLKIGKMLESLVIQLLKDSGISLIVPSHENNFLQVKDPDFEYFSGHMDLILVSPIKGIGEIKTAKNSSFNQFKKHGLKHWQPIYYSQCQAYMGMSGIHECYIIVINKDTSEVLDELITFDRTHYDELKHKVTAVYYATSLPPRVRNNPAWYLCKMCNYKGVCYGSE